MDRNFVVITFFQKIFILRRPRTAIFADSIKTVTMFNKKMFKDSRKVKKKIEIIYQNRIYICISGYGKIC